MAATSLTATRRHSRRTRIAALVGALAAATAAALTLPHMEPRGVRETLILFAAGLVFIGVFYIGEFTWPHSRTGVPPPRASGKVPAAALPRKPIVAVLALGGTLIAGLALMALFSTDEPGWLSVQTAAGAHQHRPYPSGPMTLVVGIALAVTALVTYGALLRIVGRRRLPGITVEDDDRFRYQHVAWMLRGVGLTIVVSVLITFGFGGVALWQLGAEHSDVWMRTGQMLLLIALICPIAWAVECWGREK